MPRKPETHKAGARSGKRHIDQAAEAARGTSAQRGYGSRWQKARAAFLALNPLCRRCIEDDERPVAATVVDHIEPHRGDQGKFWDMTNWQSLCKQCHDRKTATEDGGFGRRKS